MRKHLYSHSWHHYIHVPRSHRVASVRSPYISSFCDEMAESSRRRTHANSLTYRSQAQLNAKQKIVNIEHQKTSKTLEKEHQDRRRVLIQRKVHLKCHYSDLSVERARAALRDLEADEDKEGATAVRRLPNIRLSLVPRRLSRNPSSLIRSKSENNLLMSTGVNKCSGMEPFLPELTPTSSLCSSPCLEQDADNISGNTPSEPSYEDLFRCRYLRMPPRLQRLPVYNSLPNIPQPTDVCDERRRAVTNGDQKGEQLQLIGKNITRNE